VNTDTVREFFKIFLSILFEAMPFIVLGAVIAGLLEELLPQRLVARFLPRSRTLAILIGGLLGLIFPMCECGIIPVMRRLIRKGLPLSCCVCYLLAGPIINVVVIISTYVAFTPKITATASRVSVSSAPTATIGGYQMDGLWMTGMRLGVGYLVAVGTSLIVEWQYRVHGDKLLTELTRPSSLPVVDEDEESERRPALKRLSNIAETSLHDFVDIMAFLIIGALLAALTRLFLSHDAIAELSREHSVLCILIMMGFAILLCLCSEADAFVAASFSTMSPAAKLAFLTLGPMLDLKLYMMYTRVFRPRLIYTIFGSVIVQVFIYACLVHLIWEKYAPDLLKLTAPSGG
jgi:uncharacterized membrane protein YraQ (UPF0718 family)